MSRIDCAVVRDVLPLYAENMASEETRRLVDEHLAGCQDCRNLLEDMTAEEEPVRVDDAGPLKRLKRKMVRKRIGIGLFVAVILVIFGDSVYGYATSFELVPYSPGIVTLNKSDGEMFVCNEDHHTLGMAVMKGPDDVLYVGVTTTPWTRITGNVSYACATAPYRNDMTVYYVGPAENTLINGPAVSEIAVPDNFYSQVRDLPRQTLGHLLFIALAAMVVLAVPLVIFRNRPRVRLWLERIILVPVSYIVGHLCVKGFTLVTTSFDRELSLITMVATVVYLLALLGLHLYRVRKDRILTQREIQ